MKARTKKKRAKELAVNARGNISSKLLTKVGPGILSGGYLSERPFIDYLNKSEQPHYVFYNETKGVTIGEKRVRTGWFHPYRSGMWITDQGVHFTVGKDDGDFHNFIQFNLISSFEAREGTTKNKFVYQTKRGECRFPSNVSGPLESAKPYIQSQLEKWATYQASSQPLESAKPYIQSQLEKRATHQASSQPLESSKNDIQNQPKNRITHQTSSQPLESSKNDIQNQPENQITHQTSSQSPRTNVSGEYTLQELQMMDEYEFEHLVADIWEKQGWTVNLTPGSADKGVDVIAIKNDPFEQRQLIQVKRYSAENKVGSSEIQKYSGLYARNESIDAVIVVTTSEFTSQAKEVAKQRNVKTINGRKVIDLLEEYDI